MRTLERVRSAVTAVASILLALIAVALVLTQALGGRIVAVLSGSMEPTYHTGSLLFVRPADPSEIREGDVIAYMVSADVMVTHRVIEVVPDAAGAPQFRTQGDANNVPDEALVTGASLVGTPRFSIPLAGYVVNYVQHPPGLYIAGAVMLLILAAAFLPQRRVRTNEQND